MQRLTCLLAVLLFFSTFVASQKPAGYYIRHYTTENGLPSNGIKGLQWDEANGFLWIATEAGISRFNGFDFKTFSNHNTPFIASERMLFVVRNNAGQIFSADQSGNILAIRGNKLLPGPKLVQSPPPYLSKLYTLAVSDLLYHDTTEYRGEIPVTLLYNPVLPISDAACYFIYDQRIYKHVVGQHAPTLYPDTGRDVLYGFKIGDKAFYLGSDGKAYDLNEDATRNKWIPMIHENGQPFTGIDSSCRMFWTNGMKNPFIINSNRAWSLSRVGDTILCTLICDEIPTDAFIDYVQYSETKKLLFVGTNSKGIIVLSKNRLDAMRSSHPGAAVKHSYYSQLALDDGNVLTGEGHIVGKNPVNIESVPIKGKFGNYLYLENDSLLWYSSLNPETKLHNLYTYNYNTKKTTVYPRITSGENIICPVAGGYKMIVTEFGIGRLSGDSVNYYYRHAQPTYNTISFDAIEAEPGIMLLATCSGILRYNIGSAKLDTLLFTGGNCIRSIWKYKDYIFFGSYGRGIIVLKNGILKNLPLDKRKYLLYSHCFMPDEAGFCWISTNRGLFKASVAEMINAWENENAKVYYHYFGKSDGMNMVEMNGGCTPCAVKLKNKAFSFPTMDGLLMVDPATATPNLPDGQIYIDEITADSIDADPEEPATLVFPPKTKDITIRLAFSAWCNKENIYIDYRLNDDAWKPVDTDKDASLQFNNLPSGKHILTFRKVNGFGDNNYSYKTLEFQVVTPWHKKWWFAMLLFTAVIGMIILFVHLRTNNLRKNQQRLEKIVTQKTRELQESNAMLEKSNSIKTRLISIISHDIVTPLKFLTIAGKNLLEKKQLMTEDVQKETISEITNTSQELQLLSTNILNWIKYQTENRRLAKENINLHELVNQVTGVLGSYANQKRVRLVNDTGTDFHIYQYFEPLKIIIYNLVSNAINFTDSGKVTISNAMDDGTLLVTVTDEGAGMTAEQVRRIMEEEIIVSSANMDKRKGHGLGYLIIKDLVKTMGVGMHIESNPGKGTMVTIIIPTGKSTS